MLALLRRHVPPRRRIHVALVALQVLSGCGDGPSTLGGPPPLEEPAESHEARALQALPAPGADAVHGHAYDHCAAGEQPDARAAQLVDLPAEWRSPRNGAIDLALPQDVLAWMGERVWEASHDAWHNVRRCQVGFGRGNALCSRPELVPADQECASAGDGYQFLVMHRHMMQALRQAFPKTPDLFAGFPKFPYDAQDVPAQWRDRFGSGWSSSIKETASVLENIEKELDRFPTEGDLGRFIQCGTGFGGASSIHAALHFKWVVNDSPYSLGKQPVNIDNYMFWKLHGWIDQVWERYRVAKGLTPDEPKLQQALTAQCREMDTLGKVVSGSVPTSPRPADTPPSEAGQFHETVRPILEKYCSGCHSDASPDGMLSLGGKISSADVVKNLLGVPAVRGGQFMRVVAGAPDRSWLYLKVAGLASSASCTGECSTGVMPPTGAVTLSGSELGAIRSWIAAGAPAPTR